MDVSSKNPAGAVDPARAAGWARRQGVLSLGHVSLHEQRRALQQPNGWSRWLAPRRGAKAFDPVPALALAFPVRLYQRDSQRAKPEAKHESGSLKAELSPLLRRSELLLFARAKRSNQEKARPCLRALRTCGTPGPLRRRDFSTRHPCRVEKRRASMRVALRVFPVGSVAAEGDLKSKAQEPRHKQEREREGERKRRSNEKRPASAGRPWDTAGCRTGYATVEERSAAMRSSSGG